MFHKKCKKNWIILCVNFWNSNSEIKIDLNQDAANSEIEIKDVMECIGFFLIDN